MKKIIYYLTLQEFKKDYLGSYFGLFWAFVQPLSFLFLIWFVFEKGFKTTPIVGDIPFFLWLITGMIPWFFISDALVKGLNSIVSNDFLVKKVDFDISILPLVQIGAVFIMHVFLLIFLIFVLILYGYTPNLYWIQIIYYILCIFLLILGISWITSSLRVFIKDISNIINILLQFGFWMTPIFWNINMIPNKYQIYFKINPFYYIIEGYRDTFLNHVWFWEKGYLTIYFWFLTLFSFYVGRFIFRKLKLHFGDVL